MIESKPKVLKTNQSMQIIINVDSFGEFMSFPYHKQEAKYTCGAASARMALEFCGIKKDEKQVIKLLGTNKVRGSWIKNFPRVAEMFKLDYVVKRNAKIEDLRRFHKDGYVIIIDYFYPPEKVDHYSILRKIDSKNIYFCDPFFGPRHKYPLSYFKKIWKCDPKYDPEKRWFIAIRR